MDKANQNLTPFEQAENDFATIIIDAKKLDNAVLERLIGEIKTEKENRIHSYNRTHNRHNRGR